MSSDLDEADAVRPQQRKDVSYNVAAGVREFVPDHSRDDDEVAQVARACDLNHNFAIWQGYGLFGLNVDSVLGEEPPGTIPKPMATREPSMLAIGTCPATFR
jgi:hypothetical protein